VADEWWIRASTAAREVILSPDEPSIGMFIRSFRILSLSLFLSGVVKTQHLLSYLKLF
jgi:hypothetical protein